MKLRNSTRKIFIVLILGGLLLLAKYIINRSNVIFNLHSIGKSNAIEVAASEPVLAVFSLLPREPKRVIESFNHYRLTLTNTDHWDIKREEIAKLDDSIPLMITVETWDSRMIISRWNNPLDEVVKGKYDLVIKQLCTELIGTRPNVYLRFNPEMEVPVKRYPWQRYGIHYIEAFRHFSLLCKTHASQVKQVWAPAGYPGTMEYYPGDDVVDAASVTIKSESETPLTVYPKDYSLEYDLMRRLHRLRFINKPIFVMGSQNMNNDSINAELVSSISNKIDAHKYIIYAKENFQRPKVKIRDGLENEILIGLYDPQSLLNEDESVRVEHLFTDFDHLNNGSFEKSFKSVLDRGHDVIVTFEPLSNPREKTDLDVLRHVTEGKYDREIARLYSIITATDHRIYLRYAHEMEIPITRYPWQSQDPLDYIKSYRYFMTFNDSLPARLKRVWGPAGDRGSIEWWPGNDVVDYMSIAIYGLPDKNITDPEKQESFSTIFNRKIWRLRFIDKPIFITEFGVKGPEEFQSKWLENAAKVIRDNPRVKGVNYFNMTDTPKAWGKIKPPDWSISEKSFHHFLETLNE